MSKSTAAVILVSPAHLAPWGDEGWRFSGAMQLVPDGPDWLYAQWPVLDGQPHHGVARFASLVLRDQPTKRAADIAVMALALLQVEEWSRLHSWWESTETRTHMQPLLEKIALQYAGEFKLAVVDTGRRNFNVEIVNELERLGFAVVTFAPVG